MPKSKAIVSTDSDSGSDNEKPVAKKQKKTADKAEKKADKAEKKEGKGFKNESGDMTFELGKNKRVTVRSFKSMTLIDIREYYCNADGDFKPGKKGISLQPDQWRILKDLFTDIDEAVEKM